MIQRALEEKFQMKIFILTNKILSFLLIILLWFILSKIYPPIVVPSVSQVWESIKTILSDISMLKEIFTTLLRLFIGFTFGVIFAIIFNLIVTRSKMIGSIFYPIIEFLQVIPPISWLILAILWLGLNGKPAILIVSISIFCIMSISLVNSIENIDKKLLEVADIFQISKLKKWKYIIVPSLYPAFETALIVCLGTGVKLIVMAEVLSTDSGIGGEITNARLNIETEMVIAWSVIIVGIYFILGGIVKCLKKCQWIRRFWYQSLLVKDMMKN